MKYYYQFICAFLLLIPIFTQAQNKIQLFNQQDLKGWYGFQTETGKLTDASEIFTVENNMIRLFGAKAGYLMSEESFQDFQLTVDFKWNTDTSFARKSNSKNSGVMYLVPTETLDMLWPKGFQFQIKEGATGDIILLHEVTLNIKGIKTVPGKSIVAKRFKDAANPIGDWNTLVVTVKNGSVTQELNGKLVNQGTEPSVSKGRILLQYEGFPIDFRKVEIEKL